MSKKLKPKPVRFLIAWSGIYIGSDYWDYLDRVTKTWNKRAKVKHG